VRLKSTKSKRLSNKVIEKQDFDTYDKLQRGEIDSQISGIIFSDTNEDPYGE